MGNNFKILIVITGIFVQTSASGQTLKLKWKHLGPFETPAPDIDTGYVTPTGMGWIECVADDGTGNLYAGSNSGGLYRTTDGGKNWEKLKTADITYGILDLKITPKSEDIWVATGTTVNEEPYGIGILRSRNGGKSFQSTALAYSPHDKRAVWQFEILNQNREALAAVTQNHIVYAESGMEQPKDLFGGDKFQFRQLLLHPAEKKIWYASGNHLCISYNNGKDWNIVNDRLLANHEVTGDKSISRIAIALSPANPDYLWAAYQYNFVNYIQLSRDKGHSWQLMGTNRVFSRFDIHHAEFKEDPKDSNVLYAGAVRMFVSQDRGKTFTSVSNPAWGTPTFMHDDIRALEFTQGGSVLTGNDGGVSVSNDQGKSWKSLNGKGLTVTQIYSMALHPKRKGDLIMGCQDLSSMKYFKGKWSNTSRLYGDGGPCLYREGDIPWAIICQNAMLLASDNDGEGWNSLGNPQITNKLYFPLFNDPHQQGVIYSAWYNLWRKAGDEWWENLSEKADGGGYAIQAATVVRGKPFLGYISYDQPAWKTGDDLKGKLFAGHEIDEKIIWTDLTARLPILSWRFIRCMATIPGDSMQIWVGMAALGDTSGSNRIFYSADAGHTWKDISFGLPVNSVNKIIVRDHSQTYLWAATDEGLWVFFNDKWHHAGKKIPKMIVRDFHFSKNNEVYAATYGCGVWKAKVKKKYRR